MLQEIIQSFRERGLLKWVIAGLVLLVAILLVSLLLQPRYTRHTLQTTPYTVSGGDFSRLVGSDIYAYNGAVFYKVSATDPNDINILADGVKLPVPSQMTWAGDRGVLVNFRESYGLTEVDKFLRRQGSELSEAAQNYTWYFDFDSKSLHKVHEKPLVSNVSVYSAEENGFYYVPDLFFTPLSEAGDDFPENIPLNFYDIGSDRSREVVNDLALLDITHINTCHSDAYKVCLVGRDEEDIMKLRLYGIDQGGKKEVLLESDARLIPTNDPNLFITTAGLPEEEELHEGEDEEDHEHIEPFVDFSPSPALLHNLSEGTTRELDFDIAGEAIMPYFSSLEDFYVLNSETASLDKGDSVYRSGTTSMFGNVVTKEFPLQTPDSLPYDNSFAETIDYGDNGLVLVTSASGDKFLFAPRGVVSDTPVQRVAQSEAQEIVKNCADNHGDSFQYFDEENIYRVFFVDNSRFNSNLEAFTDCLADRNSKVFIGNNFYLGGVDPVNGRIVSD